MALTHEQFLERCQEIGGEDTTPDLYGFFNLYRPHGEKLDELFADVDYGEEMARRIRAAMAVDGTEGGLGVEVRNPLPTTREEALQLTSAWFDKLREWAIESKEEYPLQVVNHDWSFRSVDEFTKDQARNEATIQFHNELCDCIGALIFDPCDDPENGAYVLHDALYTLVYDFHMTHYIEWPMAQRNWKVEDPFAPYFEMWRRKIKFRIADEEPHVVEVCCPAR